jgi:hypothetical protein
MVKGLLLIQFSPAMSGAGLPMVMAVPCFGDNVETSTANMTRVQKVTERDIWRRCTFDSLDRSHFCMTTTWMIDPRLWLLSINSPAQNVESWTKVPGIEALKKRGSHGSPQRILWFLNYQ